MTTEELMDMYYDSFSSGLDYRWSTDRVKTIGRIYFKRTCKEGIDFYVMNGWHLGKRCYAIIAEKQFIKITNNLSEIRFFTGLRYNILQDLAVLEQFPMEPEKYARYQTKLFKCLEARRRVIVSGSMRLLALKTASNRYTKIPKGLEVHVTKSEDVVDGIIYRLSNSIHTISDGQLLPDPDDVQS